MIPKIDWIRSLPKKVSSTAVIFFNQKNELLILKPTYREGWQVPGGVLEECESPLEGAQRETKEEIGIESENLSLVGVVHGRQLTETGEKYDVVYFTFFGGILSEEKIKQIVLEEREISEYRFIMLDEALQLLHVGLRERVRLGMEAYRTNKIMYSEYDFEKKTQTIQEGVHN